ncbi:MAG: S24/S26 family peptidase [Clostridia bacterium]|nr:S24/S26 family peptidase [Clostridia bacterium]
MERQQLVLTDPAELSPVVQACLENGSEVVLTVTGNSMRPMLRHRRDQVILKRCDPRHLQVGDLPLYRRADGTLVLHRVVALGVSTYTMCGDAQTEKEYGVPWNAVLAVAVGFHRGKKIVWCNRLSYRLYVRLWMLLMPLRPILLKGIRLMTRGYRKVRGIFQKKAGRS